VTALIDLTPQVMQTGLTLGVLVLIPFMVVASLPPRKRKP